MRHWTTAELHPSKIAALILYLAVVVTCIVLDRDGHPTAGRYLIPLLLPSVPIVLYIWTTGDRRILSEPLSFSKIFRAYFRENGGWVLFWLVLLFVLTTLIEFP